MTLSRELAEFIRSARLEDINGKVAQKAKLAITDTIAVTLGGHPLLGEKVDAFARQMGGTPQATTAVSGIKTDAPLAAFVNATLAHALDYDDLNQSMGGHPSAPVWPAAMAVGEMIGASGKDVLLAYILGCEIETKLGAMLGDRLYTSGWHPTSVLGILGAAAASARLLELDITGIQMAIGIAASFAAGLKQNFGTMTKPLHIGQAAKNGVTAAILAKGGWDSSTAGLDGENGFVNQFCGQFCGKSWGHKEFDTASMIRILGKPWEFDSPGIQQKKYPCCGSTHSSIEAALNLIRKHPVSIEKIEQITCHVHPKKTHILAHPDPKDGLEAKFSLEYCVAAAIRHKKVTLELFQESHIRDGYIQDTKTASLLAKLSVNTDGTLPDWAGQVDVTTRSGKIFQSRFDEVPCINSKKDLAEKFYDCAMPQISRQACNGIMDLVNHFEGQGDLSVLAGFLKA